MPKLIFVQLANENINNRHCQELSSVYKNKLKQNQSSCLSTRDRIVPIVSTNEYSSKVNNEKKSTVTCTKFLKVIGSQSFPQQLMSLLNRNEYEDVISWMPNGNTFTIHQKQKINEVLAASYCFQDTKFESFRRKLNRWGFKIIKTGVDTGSYYHEYFLRDQPLLCSRVRCIKRRPNICKNKVDDQLEETKDSTKILYEHQIQHTYVSKTNDSYEASNFAKKAVKGHHNQGSKSEIYQRQDMYLQNTPDLGLKLQEYLSNNFNNYLPIDRPNRVSEGLLLKQTYLSSKISPNIENSIDTGNFQKSFLSVLADVSTEKIFQGVSKMSIKKRFKVRKDDELYSINHCDIQAKLGPVLIPLCLNKDDAKPKTYDALAA